MKVKDIESEMSICYNTSYNGILPDTPIWETSLCTP